MKQLEKRAQAIKEWRVKQGFHTPENLDNAEEVIAKLVLFLEEIGEAITAVRKADMDNLIEELTDNLIRGLDLISAFNHEPLSLLAKKAGIDTERGPAELGVVLFDLILGDVPFQIPTSISTEQERRRMLIVLGGVSLMVHSGPIAICDMEEAKDRDYVEFLTALDLFIACQASLINHLGRNFLEEIDRKMEVNLSRPPRNGKVSAI